MIDMQNLYDTLLGIKGDIGEIKADVREVRAEVAAIKCKELPVQACRDDMEERVRGCVKKSELTTELQLLADAALTRAQRGTSLLRNLLLLITAVLGGTVGVFVTTMFPTLFSH